MLRNEAKELSVRGRHFAWQQPGLAGVPAGPKAAGIVCLASSRSDRGNPRWRPADQSTRAARRRTRKDGADDGARSAYHLTPTVQAKGLEHGERHAGADGEMLESEMEIWNEWQRIHST